MESSENGKDGSVEFFVNANAVIFYFKLVVGVGFGVFNANRGRFVRAFIFKGIVDEVLKELYGFGVMELECG